MRITKILGIVTAVALALLMAVAAVLYALVDTAALAQQASDWMQKKYQRSLSFEGQPALSFFPRLGIELKGAALTEANSKEVAVQLGETRLSAALWPLLRGEVQLDHISLRQPRLVLRQLGEGKTNFDDFLKPKESPAKQQSAQADASPALDIASLKIHQGQVEIINVAGEKIWNIDKINLTTGRIAPAKNLPLEAELQAHVNGANSAVAADDGGANYGGGNLSGHFKIPQFQPLAMTFDATVDDLNLDAMDLGTKPAPSKTAATKTAQPETPFNLDALSRFNASGMLRINQLQVQGVKASQVVVPLTAKNGELTLSPLKAQLYGGQLEGLFKLNAPQYRFELLGTFSDVQVGNLVRDALKKNWLDGRGNLNLDLKTSGSTPSALKRNLNGLAKMQLKDGAVKGYNLASSLNQWREKLKIFGRSGKEQQAGDTQQQTKFSEMSASFKVRQGVAFNDDLNLNAQPLHVSGNGYLDFVNNRMDYLARASLGQPNPTLTVPVVLSGSFDSINWEVQWASIAGQVLRQPFSQPIEKLGNKLKGWFK